MLYVLYVLYVFYVFYVFYDVFYVFYDVLRYRLHSPSSNIYLHFVTFFTFYL